MLFDARQFEQFFKEGPLRRGLRLFEKAKVELLAKPSGVEYHFLVNGIELFLKKKGDKVLDCNCTCRRGPYCEHLGAVMFYFQHDALEVSLKSGLQEKKKRSPKPPAYKLFWETLKNLENATLSLFLKNHEYELEIKDLREIFSAGTEVTPYDFYCLQIRILLKPYSHASQLGQEQIDALYKTLTGLIGETKKLKNRDPYFLELAIVTEFTLLFNFRYTGNEVLLFGIYDRVMKDLDLLFQKGLSQMERQAWLQATLRSVKTNKSLNPEAFAFLIPRFLSISKSKKMFEILGGQLEKRKYKNRDPGHFDMLLVARLELAIKSWELFKITFPFKNYHADPEYTIAQAELEFCRNRPDKAFRHLELKYESLSFRQKKHWGSFRKYIIVKASEKKKEEIELRFLKESFIFDLYILPKKLERFLELVPIKEQDQAIKELISQIKGIPENFSFDKTATLLFRTQKWDELIAEIKKQGNKFSLLHKIAMRKLPEYDETLLSLYVKQLLEAFSDGRVHHFQEQLFEVSKEYIGRLPVPVRQRIVASILNKMGGQSRIHKYVAQLYD